MNLSDINLFEFEIVRPSTRRNKNYSLRGKIINEKLLKYIDYTRITPQNKLLIKEYVKGKTYKELSKKYGISISRVYNIIYQYYKNVQKHI